MLLRVDYRIKFACATGLLTLPLSPSWASEPLASVDPSSRIYGGEAAKSCEWPTAIGFGSCSGTLVHPNIVIYAAHCGKQRKISFGDAYRSMHRTVKPKFCKTNPEYRGNGSLGKGVDFAFCYLDKAITDYPITPVAYGCELDQIKAGTKIWLVGYGNTDKGKYGTKHKVETEIGDLIANGNELKVGGSGKATCNGDSGGPGYVKMSDGTWRHVAISSYGFGECGQPSGMTFSKAAVPWIHKTLKEEGITDVDIVPCYNDKGDWEPTKECRGFATEPGKAHGTWEQACGGEKAPRSGFSSICGPAAGEDEGGAENEEPKVAWVSPEDGDEFDRGEKVVVKVDASDDGDALAVILMVDDKAQKKRKKEPYTWELEDLEVGKHTLVAVAKDGTHEVESAELEIEILDSGSQNSEDSENGEDDSAGGEASGGDAPDSKQPEDSDTEEPKEDEKQPQKSGGCRAADQAPRPAIFGGLLALGLLLRRKRRESTRR